MNDNNMDVNPNAEEIKNLEAKIAGIDVSRLDPRDNGRLLQESPVVEQNVQQPETHDDASQAEVMQSEDPITAELERIKGDTNGKSQKDKFEYKLKRELAQAKQMGIDVAKLAGIESNNETETSDDDRPLTKREVEEMLRSNKAPSKSAFEMALEIQNEAEKELHLYYLENKVNPALSEEEKFQTAKEMVTALKLKNQVQLSQVKPQPKSYSTASSYVPPKQAEVDSVKLTPEEDMLFRDAKVRGINLTKEEIIKMRK